MSTTELIAIVVACISGLGNIALAIYAFRNNASGIKNDIIKTYETRLSQMEDDMDTVRKKLAEIKALLDKREGELKTITDVLQGRNPEMQHFLEEAGKSAKQSLPYMHRTTAMIELLLHHFSLPIPPNSPQ